MSRVRDRDSKAEMTVRHFVHSLGFRYRLHVGSLPGKPDLVFSRHKKIIFVHGCFWHRHANCKFARLPKSRLDFWLPKLERNHQRDLEVSRDLKKAGWRILVIWECEIAKREKLENKIKKFME